VLGIRAVSAAARRDSIGKSALIDEAMDRYVEWREECAAVNDAYANWTNAPTEEADLPFVAYSAALDREQSAATVYGRALKRLERSL
jgi:predicted aminopeptidase